MFNDFYHMISFILDNLDTVFLAPGIVLARFSPSVTMHARKFEKKNRGQTTVLRFGMQQIVQLLRQTLQCATHNQTCMGVIQMQLAINRLV